MKIPSALDEFVDALSGRPHRGQSALAPRLRCVMLLSEIALDFAARFGELVDETPDALVALGLRQAIAAEHHQPEALPPCGVNTMKNRWMSSNPSTSLSPIRG